MNWLLLSRDTLINPALMHFDLSTSWSTFSTVSFTDKNMVINVLKLLKWLPDYY